MSNNETATIYTLRVDVTVPHADGQPEYSATEIVNRVDAALFHVPGNCDVRVQEYSATPELVTVKMGGETFVGVMEK